MAFKLSEEERACPLTDVFEILDKIGEGSYGSVFRGRHRRTGAVVALKQVPIDGDLESLMHEIAVLESCDSPSIIALYGFYVEERRLWIVMEYCEAGSVSDIVRVTDQNLSEQHIAFVIRDTLHGLAYLHGNGKIHRDIKAGNILIREEGHGKLADFGVAGQLSDAATKRNTVIGTPYWMAPEVIQEIGYTTKADIWSLGITCIELADGFPPYHNIHPMRAIFMIPSRPSPKLSREDLWSPDFCDFIARCLTKNPDDRPAAEELLHDPFILNLPEEESDNPMIALARSAVDLMDKEREMASTRSVEDVWNDLGDSSSASGDDDIDLDDSTADPGPGRRPIELTMRPNRKWRKGGTIRLRNTSNEAAKLELRRPSQGSIGSGGYSRRGSNEVSASGSVVFHDAPSEPASSQPAVMPLPDVRPSKPPASVSIAMSPQSPLDSFASDLVENISDGAIGSRRPGSARGRFGSSQDTSRRPSRDYGQAEEPSSSPGPPSASPQLGPRRGSADAPHPGWPVRTSSSPNLTPVLVPYRTRHASSPHIYHNGSPAAGAQPTTRSFSKGPPVNQSYQFPPQPERNIVQFEKREDSLRNLRNFSQQSPGGGSEVGTRPTGGRTADRGVLRKSPSASSLTDRRSGSVGPMVAPSDAPPIPPLPPQHYRGQVSGINPAGRPPGPGMYQQQRGYPPPPPPQVNRMPPPLPGGPGGYPLAPDPRVQYNRGNTPGGTYNNVPSFRSEPYMQQGLPPRHPMTRSASQGAFPPHQQPIMPQGGTPMMVPPGGMAPNVMGPMRPSMYAGGQAMQGWPAPPGQGMPMRPPPPGSYPMRGSMNPAPMRTSATPPPSQRGGESGHMAPRQ